LPGTFRIAVTTRNPVSTRKAPTLHQLGGGDIGGRGRHAHVFPYVKEVMNKSYIKVNPLKIVCIWTERIRPTFFTANSVTWYVTCEATPHSVSTCNFIRGKELKWLSGNGYAFKD
jgi:hypothetical protein